MARRKGRSAIAIARNEGVRLAEEWPWGRPEPSAGPDTIALIYYNGYALQFEGDNYLIPVDAQLNRDSEIPIQGIRLFDLLRPLADAPATTKIVILDAARPLPF